MVGPEDGSCTRVLPLLWLAGTRPIAAALLPLTSWQSSKGSRLGCRSCRCTSISLRTAAMRSPLAAITFLTANLGGLLALLLVLHCSVAR